MAFFRPILSDPFFATPSSSLFSPSSSLLFDDDPFLAATPLYLYDAPTSRRRAGGKGSAGQARPQQQQLQLKEQQAVSQDNAQVMVSGGGSVGSDKATTPNGAITSSSPANKQAALTNSNNNNNKNNSLRQPRLLSPLSLLSAFDPATSLLSSRAVLPSMSVDLLSTDAEYTVHASVPGVAKQDLKVTVDDGVLTIEAERREETKQSSRANSNSNNKQPANITSPRQQPQQDEKEREVKAETEPAGNDNNSSSTQPMEAEQDDNSSPQYHHVESFYGHISRSITLPDDCNTDSMVAKYEDGVLKIAIPRLQEKRQRGTRLEIQ